MTRTTKVGLCLSAALLAYPVVVFVCRAYAWTAAAQYADARAWR